MITKIELQVKKVYGTTKYYPQCQRSIILCRLLQQKTLTDSNLAYIKELGYTIEYYVDLGENNIQKVAM